MNKSKIVWIRSISEKLWSEKKKKPWMPLAVYFARWEHDDEIFGLGNNCFCWWDTFQQQQQKTSRRKERTFFPLSWSLIGFIPQHEPDGSPLFKKLFKKQKIKKQKSCVQGCLPAFPTCVLPTWCLYGAYTAPIRCLCRIEEVALSSMVALWTRTWTHELCFISLKFITSRNPSGEPSPG